MALITRNASYSLQPWITSYGRW